MFKRFLHPLFFSKRFYILFSLLIILFLFAYASVVVFAVARILVAVFFLLVVLDYIVLFNRLNGVTGDRLPGGRFGLGDDNPVTISLKNNYSFGLSLTLIDELPVQFQLHNFKLKGFLPSNKDKDFHYTLRPVLRGEYHFNVVNVFVRSPLDLVVRRYRLSAPFVVKVYPSYQNLRKFDLAAYSNSLMETGHRRVRKIGQSVEFEQIREYVNGDDIRTLNWKATARKGGQLMVNNYTDEKSQQIYCFIDKGRVMKMPFNGMTLLDYSINATLMLSRVALLKQDKAGLLTFNNNIDQFLLATRKPEQINTILETLYNQQTRYEESDFEKLYAYVRARIVQRSLIVLFTNFESITGLQRHISYILAMAKTHLVLIVFFENTELKKLTELKVDDIETLYKRTIAGKFSFEKRQMVRELQQHGILTILTPPEQLTINAVNKYLELKARQAI